MGRSLSFKYFTKFVVRCGLVYCYSHIFRENVLDAGICKGSSMEPNLGNCDVVLLKKIHRYAVERGDIVVFRHPCELNTNMCKRVIHVPGDFVRNGEFSEKISKGMIWVEGDNQAASTDSRHFGPLPKGLILGKAVIKIWPSIEFLGNEINMQ